MTTPLLMRVGGRAFAAGHTHAPTTHSPIWAAYDTHGVPLWCVVWPTSTPSGAPQPTATVTSLLIDTSSERIYLTVQGTGNSTPFADLTAEAWLPHADSVAWALLLQIDYNSGRPLKGTFLGAGWAVGAMGFVGDEVEVSGVSNVPLGVEGLVMVCQGQVGGVQTPGAPLVPQAPRAVAHRIVLTADLHTALLSCASGCASSPGCDGKVTAQGQSTFSLDTNTTTSPKATQSNAPQGDVDVMTTPLPETQAPPLLTGAPTSLPTAPPAQPATGVPLMSSHPALENVTDLLVSGETDVPVPVTLAPLEGAASTPGEGGMSPLAVGCLSGGVLCAVAMVYLGLHALVHTGVGVEEAKVVCSLETHLVPLPVHAVL